MFDGVPDQFHQFITPRTSPLPLHLPFPLHASAAPNNNNNTFPFDPYNPSHHHHQLPFQPNLLHPLHHKDEEKEESNSNTVPNPMNFQIERDQRQQQQQLPQLQQQVDPWTNDEVLALLRIRSSMESWFPEFSWEHVSRKLAEVGYKRSAEKCKEKFEEESRYFTNINYTSKSSTNINYRFLSELEELYDQNNEEVGTQKSTHQQQQDNKMEEHAMEDQDHHDSIETKQNDDQDVVVEEKLMKDKKRKRGDRFEVFKGFCESVVNNMMAQQEEMHRKIIEDMVRRDEEKFTREEAWKKQEMDKMNKELEMMAHEQAIAGDRQANIIEFLKKFEKNQRFGKEKIIKVTKNGDVSSPILNSQNPSPSTPSSTLPNSSCALVVAENPSSINLGQDTSSQVVVPSENPSSSSLNPVLETNSVLIHKGSMIEKDDVGRRWPKDEVLALINLRCNGNNNEDKEGGNNNKAPLWERISQGMLELGYKRSAKRCKEKWENINKYFRKTKDNTSKKRSLDSRTCPYFHLLSNLYNQGKLVPQLNNVPVNPPDQTTPQAESSSQVGSGSNFTVQQQQKVDDHEGEKTLMQQVPPLDFDQF